jgi:NIPSNAP
MITFVRTFVALPGKMYELLALAKENVALAKKLTGVDFSIASVVGGTVGEIASIANVNDLAHLEEVAAKLNADADWRAAVSKSQTLCVPAATHDHIWRHV